MSPPETPKRSLPVAPEAAPDKAAQAARRELAEKIKMDKDDLALISSQKQEELEDLFAEHKGDLPPISYSEFVLTRESYRARIIDAHIDYKAIIASQDYEQQQKTLEAFKQSADNILQAAQTAIAKAVDGNAGWLNAANVAIVAKESAETGKALATTPRHKLLSETFLNTRSNDPTKEAPKTETLYELTTEYAESDPESEKLLWGILRSLSPQKRIELLNHVSVHNRGFLEPLITKATTPDVAVFSGEEVASVKGLKPSPPQMKEISQNWEDYNTIKEAFYYDNGASVLAGMNTPGILLTVGQGWGLATAGTNLIGNLLHKRREWTTNPLLLIDRVGEVLKNEYFLAGTATYLGVKAIENPAPLGAEAEQKVVAHRRFQKLVGNRYHNEQWESFMGLQSDTVGLQILEDYAKSLSAENSDEIPENLKSEDFLAFLDLYKADPDDPTKKVRDDKLLAVLEKNNIPNPQKYLSDLKIKFNDLEDKDRLRAYLETIHHYKIDNKESYQKVKETIKTHNV